VRPCAHSSSRAPKKRSSLPFQRGVYGGMRMWRAPSLVERLREPVAGVALGVVAEDGLDRTAALLRIQAAARVRVMETLTAFSVLCSSA
jgi:hypothetical protein